MITKEFLLKTIGGPFTTKKELAEILKYKNPRSVDKYFKDLERVGGSRYRTEDVVDMILYYGIK